MPFKTRRQKHSALLKADGFLGFEARALSKLKRNHPALRALRKTRLEFLEKFNRFALKHDLSKAQYNKVYRTKILNMYKRRKWVVEEGPKGRQRGARKGCPSPWAMYREFESASPSDSPSEKEYKRLQRIQNRAAAKRYRHGVKSWEIVTFAAKKRVSIR